MTVKELIVETELQVQRLAGNKRNKTASDITIWRLNTAQNRIIKDRVRPDPNQPGKYMLNQKANTDLQAIQTPNFKLISFKDTDTRSYGYLPYDFGYLLNCRSKVLDDCKTSEFATALLPSYSQTVTVIEFGDSPLSSPPYYVSIRCQVNADSVTFVGTGSISKNQKFEYIANILKGFKSLGLEAYWETFDSIYKPGCVLVVHPFPRSGADVVQPTPTIALVLDTSGLQNATTNTIKGVGGDGNFRRYKTYTELTREIPNRCLKDDFLYDAVSNNYYDMASPNSPICHLMDNKIFVHSNKKFLVSEIIIDYVRKPRPISLSLNQTSELDEEIHEEICSVAAELILGNQEAPNYPLKVQENLTRLE